jgi:hypothetical protein
MAAEEIDGEAGGNGEARFPDELLLGGVWTAMGLRMGGEKDGVGGVEDEGEGASTIHMLGDVSRRKARARS